MECESDYGFMFFVFILNVQKFPPHQVIQICQKMADTTNGNDIFTRKIKINISEADSLSIGISGENTENNLCFIFIHGAGSSKYTWHFQISRFKHFFLTVALDWRGHGESSDFSSNSTMKNIVEDIDKALLCLREIISNRSVVLVGHSVGFLRYVFVLLMIIFRLVEL
jgi:pimeloyl-ACP methyl ester carboxylesterase